MWRVPDPWSYSYLLGMYLGDGWVGVICRSSRLSFSLDLRYPEIIEETVMATQPAALSARVTVREHPRDRCVIVYSYGKPHDQSLQDSAAERARRGVRVSALLLLEPLGRHPRPVLRYCERLGVRWTQSNHRNISVSHRHSVAILDGFIGPKA